MPGPTIAVLLGALMSPAFQLWLSSPRHWSSRRGVYLSLRTQHRPRFCTRVPLFAEPSRADFLSGSGAFPQASFCLTFLSPYPSWLVGQGSVLVSSQSPLMGDGQGEGLLPRAQLWGFLILHTVLLGELIRPVASAGAASCPHLSAASPGL